MGLERSRGERRRTEKFSSRSVGSPRRLGPRGGEENPQGKKDRARLTKRTLVGSQGAFYQTNSSFFSLKTTRMAQTHRANVIIQICLLRPLQKTVCSSSQCGSTFPNFSWAARGSFWYSKKSCSSLLKPGWMMSREDASQGGRDKGRSLGCCPLLWGALMHVMPSHACLVA